ncbi:MAG TPA: hypothetical protein VLV90_13095 [Burkholderiales bacterium]|nr:hypothetical protein [Burkholderiales bacterium]
MWQGSRDRQVPLPVAAAFAFRRLHEGADQTVPLLSYRSDLDLVAAALSRHCSIFSSLADGEPLTLLTINLRNQRFANGGTELQCIDDGFFFNRLSVLREEIPPAIALMKRAGLTLNCQNFPVQRTRHLHARE